MPDRAARLDGIHRGDEQISTVPRQTRQEVTACFALPNAGRPAVEDRPGIETLVDAERRHTRDGIPMTDGVLHGGGTTPPRQQGKMQIDPTPDRHIEGVGGNEPPVGDDGAAVRGQGPQVLCDALLAQVDGRQDRDAEALRPQVHGTGAWLTATTGSRGGTGQDGHDLVTGADQRIEAGYGDIRGAGKNKAHPVRASGLRRCGD